jgi:predicted phosphodiesterase
LKDTSFIAFSCPHHPYQNKQAIDWLCEKAEKLRPNVVVHVGDNIDGEAASKWARSDEAEHVLEEEFNTANDFLKRIRTVSRADRCILMSGNHDQNCLSQARIPKALRSLCDWRKHMSEIVTKQWEVYPYIYPTGPIKKMPSVFRIGQVSFAHGYTCGPRSDHNAALDFGTEYGLHIQGHTHAPTQGIERVFYSPKRPANRWCCNVGHMADFSKLEYAHRINSSTWGTACVYGEAPELKSPRESVTWKATQYLYGE